MPKDSKVIILIALPVNPGGHEHVPSEQLPPFYDNNIATVNTDTPNLLDSVLGITRFKIKKN